MAGASLFNALPYSSLLTGAPALRNAAQGSKPNAQMQAVLDELAAFNAPPITSVSTRVARELPTPADAVTAVLVKQGKNAGPEPVGSVTQRVIPGAGEDISIRIYTPKGNGPFPVLVYFHGGGWVIADLNTYDSSARALTNAAGCIVVSVAYRRAPEYPFPTPPMDGYAATQWVMKNAAMINGDPTRVAVGGESAGGNMAAVVSLMARDQKAQMPIYQLLVYPVGQLVNLDTPSYQMYADAKPLSKPLVMWFGDRYLANKADAKNPYASPALAPDLSKLPPATIINAEIDPLRDDGKDLADKLTKAGVKVAYQNFEGVTHEFFGMGAVVDEAKQAVALAAKGLRSAFGT